ncbi:hypothetical protein [Bradyrhizobium sp. S3.12.5]|uniref:hypothetical protein n=1 Tax=Bradyrhizobium sp. S3.12.5 TaxID=3156386 RepID=UPI0033968906
MIYVGETILGRITIGRITIGRGLTISGNVWLTVGRARSRDAGKHRRRGAHEQQGPSVQTSAIKVVSGRAALNKIVLPSWLELHQMPMASATSFSIPDQLIRRSGPALRSGLLRSRTHQIVCSQIICCFV